MDVVVLDIAIWRQLPSFIPVAACRAQFEPKNGIEGIVYTVYHSKTLSPPDIRMCRLLA